MGEFKSQRKPVQEAQKPDMGMRPVGFLTPVQKEKEKTDFVG